MPGKVVEVKSGKGKTDNKDQPVNGKVIVYLDKGGKVLCTPENIKLVGFWD